MGNFSRDTFNSARAFDSVRLQHGSTLSFVSCDPGNPNDYRKFVINRGNWGARKRFLEFGYTEKAGVNPHEYANDVDTTLTLDGINTTILRS